MDNSAIEIANLLYRYAECIDEGRLEDAAALFRHAWIQLQDGTALLDEAALLALWRRIIVLYPGGTPRTQHVISNLIIEVDEAAGTATARSRYTVFQATETFKLQAVVCGRYHDAFERADGRWRFTRRQYRLDLAGDTSAHIRNYSL